MTTASAILRCSFVLLTIFSIAFPAVRRLLGANSEGLTFPLVFLVWAYLYWILGLTFGVPAGSTISAVILIVAIAVLYLAAHFVPRDLHPTGKTDWLGVFLFAVFFLGAIWIRSLAPSLEQAEKFSDMAMFQAVLHSSHFPPQDRWLSGYPLNYYYFSFLLFVPITRLMSLAPEWSLNLNVCLIAGMTAWSVYSLAVRLSGKRWVGVASAAMVQLLSNWEWTFQAAKGNLLQGFSWWSSSRAILNTITEFPFFSLLLGDFHAHFTALPWLSLAFACVLALRSALRLGERGALAALLVFTSLAVGVHYPLNPWEIPFVALLTAVFLGRYFWATATVGLGALLFYLPFWLTYERPVSFFGWVSPALRSPLLPFLSHWGPFFLPLFLIVALKAKGRPADWTAKIIAVAAFVLVGPSIGVTVALGGMLFSVGALSIAALESVLCAGALVWIALCELIHLDNLYGPELARMNTVFKFYTVAWWALAVATPVLVWKERAALAPLRRWRWAALVVIIAAGLVYPFQAVRARRDRIAEVPTLDGLAYWHSSRPGERAGVEWLRENTGSEDVLFEATKGAYNQYSGYATFSGRPTVIGWVNHEWIWRRDGRALTGARQESYDRLLREPSAERLESFLQTYKVRWIVVGSLEKKDYPPALLDLIRAYPPAFSNDGVAIFSARRP